jgi:hypothetical protein
MTNPLNLLPLIDGDTYTFFDQGLGGDPIRPGKRETVQVGVDRGFYFGAVTTLIGKGAENTELSIQVDNFRADVTPKQLFETGFVNPIGITPGVSRYDTDNNIFTAIHNPQMPIGFNDTVRFGQRVPNDAESVIPDTTIFSVGITKPKKFVRQYLKLVNPGIIGGPELGVSDDELENFIGKFGK